MKYILGVILTFVLTGCPPSAPTVEKSLPPTMSWEIIDSNRFGNKIYRAKVPSGWIIKTLDYGGGIRITFVPDDTHCWEIK